MRKYFLLLMILLASRVDASGCNPNMDVPADFVAIVKVLKASDKHQDAFTAQIVRVIYIPEKENITDIEEGYLFTLSESDKLIEKPAEGGRRIKRISIDSCQRKYKIGTMYRLYATQIDDGTYNGNSFWTREVDESS